MYKMTSLIRRRSETSVDSFQCYWRERHAPVVARLPGLLRYVQSHVLPQGYRKGPLLFDGISELWFDSRELYRAALKDFRMDKVIEDEGRFVDLASKVVLPVDVHVIKDGAIPQHAVKSIEFVRRRRKMDLMEFRNYWKQVHGPIASRIGAVRRYEQNHVQMEEYERDAQPKFDGLAITWFDSTTAMRTGTTTEEYRITREDEPNFLPDGHLPMIITTEYVVV